jgi:hypothetical protein
LPKSLCAGRQTPSTSDVPGLDRIVHALGYVLDAHQHIQFQAGRFDFLRTRTRDETFLREIFLGVLTSLTMSSTM